MQALPCYHFRCMACDNEEWEKYMIVDTWYEWRYEVMCTRADKQGMKTDVSLDSIKEWLDSLKYTRDYDLRDDEDYDSDRVYDSDRGSCDSDSTHIPWQGCRMQDYFGPICVSQVRCAADSR